MHACDAPAQAALGSVQAAPSAPESKGLGTGAIAGIAIGEDEASQLSSACVPCMVHHSVCVCLCERERKRDLERLSSWQLPPLA